jgi:hypothetical protein
MICTFCSRSLDDLEEPVLVKHLALGSPLGPKETTGIDIVNVLICGTCADHILSGLQKSRSESSKARAAERELRIKDLH